MIPNKYLYFIRLMRNERLPLEKLRLMQNRKLRRLVRHAVRHVPFYRNQFKKARLQPEDIQTVADLHKIPVIDKNDLLQYPASDFMDERTRDHHQHLIPISTSGSSGQVLEFYIDHSYDQLRKAQFLRPYITNGNGLRRPVLWFRGIPSSKQKLHQKLGFLKEYQYYPGMDIDEQMAVIQRLKPEVMRGYGSTFHLIASKSIEEGITIHSPRLIFTDSEQLSAFSRKTIESAFRTNVIDVYGTFETENIAYECREHNGYHMAADCVIMEFIKNGRPVKPGGEGEIVCTVLDNFIFPFIRYNLHDFSTWYDTPCTCGRTFPLMGKINGRTQSYLKKRNGSNISSTAVVAPLSSMGKFIHEFQIIQEAIDQFLILVVPTRFYSRKTENEIIHLLLTDFPLAMVKVKTIDRIPRETSGKLLDFKSLLPD